MSDAYVKDYPRPVTDADVSADARDERSQPVPPAIAPPRSSVLFARALLMIALSTGVVYAGLKVSAYLVATKPEPRKRPAQEKVSFVKTVPVAFGTYQPQLKLYGETVAGRKVELRALVAGEVKQVGDGLRDGGVIEAGDTLLTINRFNYEGAVVEATAALNEAQGRLAELDATMRSERDGLKRDKEQLQISRKDAKRTAALVKRKAVSSRLLDERNLTLSQRRQTVEQRQNNIKVQTARLAQQKATLERLAWMKQQAERRLKETRLVAPFNAYVGSVNADVGRMLSASDQVATLFDRDWIEVKFVLTDQQYGRIVAASGDSKSDSLIGRAVDVRWNVGANPVSYKATIVRVGATIASGQAGITIFARIENPTSPLAIRPGAFVEVISKDRRYTDVVRLPQTSVYNNDTIYVVNSQRLVSRTVTVVGADGNNVLVQGTDLKAGDRVVATRLSAIGTGLKVEEL